MVSFKEEVFDLLYNFKQESGYVDWEVVLENEEMFDHAFDALESIINNFALLNSVPEARRVQLLGQLVIARCNLVLYYAESNRQKDFVLTGEHIVNLLHQIVVASDWLSQAEKNFDEFEQLDEEISKEELSLKELEKFRPVFLAVSIMAFITIDQDLENDYENI